MSLFSELLYRQTCFWCPRWQRQKRWSDFVWGLAGMFSLYCPHYSVWFQEWLCLLRGNEELVMVGRSQELIFLSSLFLLFLFFFLSPFCFLFLGWDWNGKSAAQSQTSWICWQAAAWAKSPLYILTPPPKKNPTTSSSVRFYRVFIGGSHERQNEINGEKNVVNADGHS